MDLAVIEPSLAKRGDVSFRHRRRRTSELLGVRLERADPPRVAGLLGTERLPVLLESVLGPVQAADDDSDRLPLHS